MGQSECPACTQPASRCFANIKADWRHILVGRLIVRLFDRELDSDVERPRRAVALQAELACRRLTVYEVVPQTVLFGVDTKRYPEIRPATGLRCPPCELVVTRRRVVELGGLVGKPNRVVVV
uniref:URF 5 n=1 Tax=Halobacterium phage phiH TaxID=169684 RepID=Q38467_BPPHH|nr:unnamed protein product [Halobacterium phage phiH]